MGYKLTDSGRSRLSRRALMRMAGLGAVAMAATACAKALMQSEPETVDVKKTEEEMIKQTKFEITKTAEEWKQVLTEEEYHVLRKHGTERAFTGDLYDNEREGVYLCAACDLELFSSETKYDSGSGWPSFFQPIGKEAIGTSRDTSFGVRTEVHCARCGGHLGHVFDDGPEPTGLRYCINSVSLDFQEE